MATPAPAHGAAEINNTSTDVDPPTDISPEQAALAAGPIIAAILQWLPVRQRCSLLSVNRAWRAAGDDPDAWAGLTPKQRRMGLIAACRRGNLALVCKRITIFNLQAMDVRARDYLAIREAVRGGNLATVQYLVDYCSLTRTNITEYLLHSSLHIAGSNGHLAVIQWMVDYFNLTSADVRDSGAGYIACVHGHLGLITWLATHFHLTTDDIHIDIDAPLQWICSFGHFRTAEWLVEHFGLTAAGLQATTNQILSEACSDGKIATVQWVVSRFGLTIDDVRGAHLTALNCAAYNGRLAVVQWMVAHFHLSAADIRDGEMLYWAACQRSQLAVVQWLVHHFGVAIVDENLLNAMRDKESECGEPLTPAEEWLVQYCDHNRQSD